MDKESFFAIILILIAIGFISAMFCVDLEIHFHKMEKQHNQIIELLQNKK